MNDLEVIPNNDLSVRLTDTAIQAMQQQREQLKAFVKSQLTEKVDYGTIPGTPKPTLYKPGAEKLMNIFQLGSRIVGQPIVVMDRSEVGFAMFTYTVEIFHIPTGRAIAQCQGSANSDEKKYKKVAIGDLLNTLQKMAQKRAVVGAVISAVGASDFFTQDLEDLKGTGMIPDAPEDLDPEHHILKYGRLKGKTLKDCSKEEIKGFIEWTAFAKVTAPGVLAQRDLCQSYLNLMDTQPPKFDDKEEIPF